MTETSKQIADREKSSAALSSVFAAVALTLFKIIVGILTGSLGILAEAAHSALDFIAALVTLFAVRLAGKPADPDHQYGHGKIENLSALFETFLLLATCAWIIYESIQRLFFKKVVVEISIWAFIVMAVSIVIDINRSRILFKAARKHNSQALEADALHFSTDIWSSAVVILGLIGVVISEFAPGLSFLIKTDAIAALCVALIVIYVSARLGSRTVKGLIDSSPPGLSEQIKGIVEKIPDVLDVHDLRIRASGPYLFVDAHLHVDGDLSVNRVHALTETIEVAIHKVIPRADILLHPEPANKK